MAVDLELLGITKEELQERVINKICADLLASYLFDDEGEEIERPNRFSEKLYKSVKEAIDKRVDELSGKHLNPKINSVVDNLCLQETNKWGEATGKPMTFREYLVLAAENYLSEEVNHNGKSKREDPYSFRPEQTRIAYLVHQYLHFHIETAMKEAVGNANKVIAEGLEKACKMKLDEIRKKLEVKICTGG